MGFARRDSGVETSRRLAILRALEGLLQDRELVDIGVREITESAGISRSSFYLYFASKEAAVGGLLGDIFVDMIGGAEEYLVGTGDPRESLHAAIGNMVRVWRQHARLFLAMNEARATDVHARALWEEWIGRFAAPAAEVVRRERDAGRARTSLDPDLLIRILIGMNEAALDRHLRSGDLTDTDERLAEALAATWSDAIYAGGP